MTSPAAHRAKGPLPTDAGISLIEVLVGIALFGVLGTLLLGFAISTSAVTKSTQAVASGGEESRLGMERLTRELRQTAKVTRVQQLSNDKPYGLTIWADFNNNGCIDPTATDPEQLTYTWNSTSQKLTLSATIGTTDMTERLLAAKVTSFDLQLNSSAWQYDTTPQDGVTTWQEIDTSSIGDNNPRNFTNAELEGIDLVKIEMTATDGTHQVEYSTQVDLRNQNQDSEMKLCSDDAAEDHP